MFTSNVLHACCCVQTAQGLLNSDEYNTYCLLDEDAVCQGYGGLLQFYVDDNNLTSVLDIDVADVDQVLASIVDHVRNGDGESYLPTTFNLTDTSEDDDIVISVVRETYTLALPLEGYEDYKSSPNAATYLEAQHDNLTDYGVRPMGEIILPRWDDDNVCQSGPCCRS